MDVIQDNIDTLNALLTVKILPSDYQGNYDESIAKYRKQVNLPGFRQGQVPASIIKQKYGPSILAEEIDKLLNKTLYEHIEEKKLNVLGNPLPKNNEDDIDWKKPSEMEFQFELGLAPEFDLATMKKQKFLFATVKVDQKLVDQQINDIAKRYGKLAAVEESGDTDMVWATFTEVDAKGNPIEGGVVHNSTVSIEFIEDKKAKKSLIGLKTDSTLVVDPRAISKGEADMASMLGITKDEAILFKNKIELKVTEIKRLHPAEITQELIDKVYGEGQVTGEEGFKARIEKDLSGMYSKDSDRLFKKNFADTMIKKLNLSLPDTFLKKWIVSSNKEGVTMEQVEADYEQYSKSLRWQLIENKIIKEHDIKVSPEEVLDYTKELLAGQYTQYGMMIPVDEELATSAKKLLENREESTKVYEALYDLKVIQFLKDNVKLSQKELSYDDFVKEAQK